MSHPSDHAATQARHDVLRVLPARADDLARLQVLGEGGMPVVTVVGKYNHGKSRLLNELLGVDAFAVADRRETVALAGREHAGVRWLDAPGIDADVVGDDDRLAAQAVWLQSDIRLFVHSAKEGELDAAELELLQALRRDAAGSRRQNLLLLTQIDQLGGDDALDEVIASIRSQAAGMDLYPVSATRHRSGMERDRPLLRESSGIPALQDTLSQAVSRVGEARSHETRWRFDGIAAELRQLYAAETKGLAALVETQARQRQDFDDGLHALLARLGKQLQAVLDVPGPDHAQTMDSAADHYRQTAAKRERARIQIAYSRACIEIDACLAGHGVVGLPLEQQTGVRAMDSIMVAVMGVSVKQRGDLRRMFCEAAGVARLHADFAGYFERSGDRVALAARIADVRKTIAAIERAIEALHSLEAPA